MLLLLTAIVVGMGITIYAACSLDDDDFGASQSELESNADGVLDLSNENQGIVYFTGVPVVRGLFLDERAEIKDSFMIDFEINWANGWTGNIISPHSGIYVHRYPMNEQTFVDTIINGKKWRHMYYSVSANAEWNIDNGIDLNFKFYHLLYDHNGVYKNAELETFEKTYGYEEIECEIDSTLYYE